VLAVPAPPAPPAPVLPPAVPAAPVGADAAPPAQADDIAAERDEDIAQWEYSLEEARASEVEADEPPSLFDEREQEAAADELFFDAADLTLNERKAEQAPVADTPPTDFEDEEPEPPPVPVVTNRPEPQPRADHAAPRASLSIASHDHDDLRFAADRGREPPADAADSRTAMTPLAIAMVLGLLLGAIAMYAYLSRQEARETLATDATQPAAPTTPEKPAGAAPTPSKEFSEQAVAQPGAKTPPASPPGVPADAAGRAGSGRANAPAAAPKPRAPAPPPAAAADPRTARLIVLSTPPGASVTINGRWSGRTPLTLDKLPLGNYVVRIVAPGYEVYREEVLLASSDESRTISERLRRSAAGARTSQPGSRETPTQPGSRPTPPLAPVPFVGSVFVDSRPRGATVFIDGKEVGTTPLKLSEISIGAHVVRLELKDHHTWTSSVRITSGEEQRVTGSLEPIR
jgi:hypothetical protein